MSRLNVRLRHVSTLMGWINISGTSFISWLTGKETRIAASGMSFLPWNTFTSTNKYYRIFKSWNIYEIKLFIHTWNRTHFLVYTVHMDLEESIFLVSSQKWTLIIQYTLSMGKLLCILRFFSVLKIFINF